MFGLFQPRDAAAAAEPIQVTTERLKCPTCPATSWVNRVTTDSTVEPSVITQTMPDCWVCGERGVLTPQPFLGSLLKSEIQRPKLPLRRGLMPEAASPMTNRKAS